MNNKIYPAIYKSVHNEEYLYADNDNYYSYERETWNKSGNCDDHENDINITQEYLTNTYGKVKSKEHAEFIFELAKLHGFDVVGSTNNAKSFEFSGDSALVLYEIPTDIFANNEESRLITIPLPPKQIQTATSEEEFEMQQIMKNNGDNLVLGCEDSINKLCDQAAEQILKKKPAFTVRENSEGEEWPCVDDEVIVRIDVHQWDVKYGHNVDGMNGVVRSIFKDDDVTVYAVSVDGVCYCFVRGLLQKPKTPEEELRDEIELIIKESIDEDYSPSANAEHITSEILSKYNITKKPQ